MIFFSSKIFKKFSFCLIVTDGKCRAVQHGALSTISWYTSEGLHLLTFFKKITEPLRATLVNPSWDTTIYKNSLICSAFKKLWNIDLSLFLYAYILGFLKNVSSINYIKIYLYSHVARLRKSNMFALKTTQKVQHLSLSNTL